jgi:two-component system, OmpR family, sensor histidine kinase TctE
MARDGRSLRGRLIGNLLVAALSMAVLLGIGGALLIHRVADLLYDRLLDGSLQAIADRLAIETGEITLDLPPAALGMLENEDRDNVYYSVRQGARLITGYDDLPAPVSPLLPDQPILHGDAVYRDMEIRLAALARRIYGAAEPVVLEVAETTNGRRRLERNLLIALAVLEAALIALSGVVIWIAVGRGLAPLTVLRGEIEERAAPGTIRMDPLPPAGVPQELVPLVDAFNILLQRLRQSFVAIRRFTADASHQMRTPLTILLTHLDLVRRLGTARDEGRTALADAAEGARRLERLIAQLLKLARADEQEAKTTDERSDLAAISAAVASERAPQAIAAGLELSFEAAGDNRPISVRGAAFMIAELIGNLLDNAIRYNRPGGTITVRITDGERPSIAITDEGPGIPEPDLALVFDRFYRVRREGPAGTGLGLSIVRTIADRLGATVVLANRVGGGLIATIHFPPAG